MFKNDYSDFNIPPVDPSEKNGANEVYVKCPECLPYRKPANQKLKTLSVNVEKGIWFCHHCGWTGGLSSIRSKQEKTGLGDIPMLLLTDTMIKYWENRGISIKTLNKCEVKARIKNIRQKDTGKIIPVMSLAFLFRNNSFLMMIKYRDGKKNFAIEKGSKMIPWGMDGVKGKKECIIVEGEPDRLSFVEIGRDDCVSVPAGSTISESEKRHFDKTGELVIENHLNLGYFDDCYEDFADKDIIYIGTDNDATGIKLRMEISRRFGPERCRILNFSVYKYEKNGVKIPCKDANEVLVHFGAVALLETMENSESFALDDIVTIDDVWSKILYQYEHGLEKGKSTGFPDLDPHFTWKISHPIAINGYPNMGKTTFTFNLLMLASMMYNMIWGVYSPENYPPEDIYALLLEIYIGNTLDLELEDRATLKEIEDAKIFIRKHFICVDKEEGYSPEKLAIIVKSLIQSNGITGFLYDPWSSLIHKKQANESLEEYLERELGAIVRLSTNNMVNIVICVHPPTPQGQHRENPPLPKVNQIRGGAVWNNKMYEIISIHIESIEDPEGKKEPTTTTLIDVQKVKKQKLVGLPTKGKYVRFKFIRRTNRYIQEDGYDPFTKTKGETAQTTDTIPF